MKKISILGSTGSIGTQALEIIRRHSDKFSVEILTAGKNADLLIQQALEFKPNFVAIADKNQYNNVSEALSHLPIKVFAGRKAIEEIAGYGEASIVLTAMVGFSGLVPTINAIKAGKNIALANKETLVIAGDQISKLVRKHKVSIIPVDSEHSAIFQCLVGEGDNPVEKIILTASGGPFRNKSIEFMNTATKQQALKHPNWDMGAKITIDSASMMNKGLEAIEAKWLFNLKPEQIEVIVHPQSIVHSLVQFADGSLKAQLGLPDMKLPILYAFTYPERIPHKAPRFDFTDYPELNFQPPDFNKFKNLKTAFYAMNEGGNIPCVMNAANEAVVEAFLNDNIKFSDLANITELTVSNARYIKNPTIENLIDCHKAAYREAQKIIGTL
ncbi:MAG: 1-deoxy-D-xylulose-5-phosphate reductoisomerase [Bacteroidota bacterium]|nr:1-deoxy-D-xylulose-5-phosphate reductoisomerase [Bacteroidota bacterium]